MRRKCHNCGGLGTKTKFISMFYSKEVVCLTCGGSGTIGGKQ